MDQVFLVEYPVSVINALHCGSFKKVVRCVMLFKKSHFVEMEKSDSIQ